MLHSLRAPLELRTSPTRELARLSLEQVRRENGLLLHIVCWIAASLFLAAVNLLTTGPSRPWSLWPIAIWGAVVLAHAYLARVRGRRRYATEHRQTGERPIHQETSSSKDLRETLLGSLAGARDALLGTAPDVAADLSLGETHALACLAWLDEADELLKRSEAISERRQDVVGALSRSGLGSGRLPLESLLGEIDRHAASLATLRQEADRRRSILESFVLALEGAVAARDRDDMLAAVTGPIRDRVTLLQTALEDSATTPGSRVRRAPSSAGPAAEARIREEVRLARQLQRSILPEAAPQVRGLSVSHLYRPSSEVGGDFYDFYALEAGRLLVAIGDASGHGLDSSMVSSMAKSALYTHVSSARDLAETMAQMNQLMADTLGRKRLMTLALLEIDVAGSRLRWVNAGQVFPLLCKADGVHELEAPSYPLGVRRQESFEVLHQRLEPGDVLLVLTDGCVEAIDHSGEPFGWNRLNRLLEDSYAAGRHTDRIIGDLSEALDRHLGDDQPQDDVTLIAIGFDG